MRLLQRRARRRQPQAMSIRPAERYLTLGANEARRLGHNYIGTEHVLLPFVRDADGDTAALLRQFGVTPTAIDVTLTGGCAAAADRAGRSAVWSRARNAVGLQLGGLRALFGAGPDTGLQGRPRCQCQPRASSEGWPEYTRSVSASSPTTAAPNVVTHHLLCKRTSNESLSASPAKLNPRTVSTIARPAG